MFAADPEFGERSAEALRKARAQGALIACEVVFAEVSAAFPDRSSAIAAMDRVGVSFAAGSSISAIEAGGRWRDYRSEGGSRERVVPDFLVATHAMLGEADRLLTRDRGFYRSRFTGLVVLDPTDG